MDIDQHDAALWACSQGQTLHRLSTAWALEDDYLCGALRRRRLTAPMVTDGPINGEMFLAYVREFLCPTLQPGDIVILDNLSSHKVSGVEEAIRATGATLLYLPPYSPDFNPIEKFFSKLKSLLRKAAKRSIDALWKQIGDLLDTVTPNECSNFFASCGYVNT